MSPFNQFPVVSVQLISLESFSCFLVVCALLVSKSFRDFLNHCCYQVASIIVSGARFFIYVLSHLPQTCGIHHILLG
jgi:hypothetical protein